MIDPLRRAVDSAHSRTGPTVLGGCALLLLVGAGFDVFTLPASARAPIVALDVALAVACVVLAVAWRRGVVHSARTDFAWVILGGLIAANVTLTTAVMREPAYGIFLMLLVTGMGAVMRSFSAFAFFATVSSIAWGFVAIRGGILVQPSTYALALVAGWVTGAVLYLARLRANARIAMLRHRDRVRGERLRKALEVARRTLEERDRNEAEKEALRVALFHAQSMDAVGTLSAAVAQDLNNVLAAILSAAEMLGSDSHLDAAGRDDVATIIDSARRGAAFTKNLLAVGRRGKYASDVLDPADLVRAALAIIERTRPVEIKIDVELAHGEARIEGDLEQLTQVVVNLCAHACAAMPDGGALSIRTGALMLDGADAHRRAVAPGEYVTIAVTDSGEGMDSEDRQRAFEPFYAGKADHGAPGLGLAMAYGAARNHGGVAEIESARGRGTMVTLHLPRAEAEPEMHPQEAVVKSSAPEGRRRTDLRGKSVLLVDDEASVRAVARRILERMDVRVHEAENGRRALVAYTTEGPFDLVLADFAMPVMGGKELFSRLRAAAPEARVVVVSGVSARDDAMELVAAGAVGVVEKPYTPGGLARAVRAALRPGAAASRPARSA